MKHALFLTVLLAALPVSADDADRTETFTYTYAHEGGASTAELLSDSFLTADDRKLMVQAKQLEIKDTQGRPVQLTIRPGEMTKGEYMVCFSLSGLAPDAEVEWQGEVELAEPETQTATWELSPQGGVLGHGKAHVPYRFLQMNGAWLMQLEAPRIYSGEDLGFTYQGKPFSPQLVAKGKMCTGGSMFLFHVLSPEGITVDLKEKVAAAEVKSRVPVSLSLKPRPDSPAYSADAGEFRLMTYQHVAMSPADAMTIINLEPVLPDAKAAVHFDLGDVNKAGLPFAVGRFKSFEGGTCSLVLGMDGIPAGAVLPVDLEIPTVLMPEEKTTMKCSADLPLPPSMSVKNASR